MNRFNLLFVPLLFVVPLATAGCGDDTTPAAPDASGDTGADTDTGTGMDAGRQDSGTPVDASSDDASTNDDGGLQDAGNPRVDAGPCVDPPPAERSDAVMCSACRPVGPEPTIAGSCTKHDDCVDGANGRCVLSMIGAICSYDDCFVDADCEDDETCSCDGSFFGRANTCVPADCRTNADCTSGRCSPSYGCLMGGAPVGWYCRTPDDECNTAADCAPSADAGVVPLGARCAYNGATSRWTCQFGICIP